MTTYKINGKRIYKLLKELGFRPNLKGFDLIIESVILCDKETEYQRRIVSKLYPALKEKFFQEEEDESISRVERAIRHSINMAFGDNAAVFRSTFNISTRPTNSEFICNAVQFLRYELLLGETKEEALSDE